MFDKNSYQTFEGEADVQARQKSSLARGAQSTQSADRTSVREKSSPTKSKGQWEEVASS